jgi:Tol biopolymer transport system component
VSSSEALPKLDTHFARYTDFDPLVPVWCVVPETRGMMHRYYDTSPFSPSGRYMALLHFPYEDRLPSPGDVAEVVLLDLETGERRVVAETAGWDTQLGASAQWGADDTELFFNDLDVKAWRPFGVKLDPFSGARQELDGTVYTVSPDGHWAASPSFLRAPITQEGYGVVVPPEFVPQNRGASAEDGVYMTDTATGDSELLVSIKEIVETATPAYNLDEYAEGDFYGAHVKWSSKGDRIMLVLRWVPWADEADAGRRMWGLRRFTQVDLVTMKRDGSEIHVAIPNSEWMGKGGHHPVWCPDGEHVMMNLNIHRDGMRFVRARYDGTDLESMSDAVYGSGHPTLHPNGRHIVTDGQAVGQEPFGDGTNAIRLVDLEAGDDRTIVRIQNEPPFKGPRNQFRVDIHPAWDYAFRRIAFNACPGGTRRVYVADLSTEL